MSKKTEDERGLATRTKDHKEMYRCTGSHRAVVRAYASGNKLAEENTIAVGNL